MTSYLNPYGGSISQPADISYSEIALTALSPIVNLEWPLLYTGANNLFTSILIVDCSTNTGELYLPDQTQGSVGAQLIIKNTGTQAFNVFPAIGTQIVNIDAGEVFFLWMTDTTDNSGIDHWSSVQLGATTTQAQAADLAGAGLIAIGSRLARNKLIQNKDLDYTILPADRDTFFIWTGGNGLFTLPDAEDVGNGFEFSINNNSTVGGILTLFPQTNQTIDGEDTFIVQPAQSLTLITDGENWNSLGFGQQTQISVNVNNKDVSGNTDIVLNPGEAERIIQQLTGELTGDITIYFPILEPNFWYIYNGTTGDFTLTVSLGTPESPVGTPYTISQGIKNIFYSDTTTLSLIPSSLEGVFPVLAPDGDLANPSYSFASDPAIGIYKTDNALNFAVNGSRCHMESDGSFYVEDNLGFANASGSGGGLNLPVYFYANNSTTKPGIGLYISSDQPNKVYNWDKTGATWTSQAYKFNSVAGTAADFNLNNTLIQLNSVSGKPTKPEMTFFVGNSGGAQGYFSYNALDQLLVGDSTSSASNPNYTWEGDDDTGLYSDAANTFKTTCGGTQTLTFDANGITPASTPVKTATFNQFSPTTTAGDMIARNNLGNDVRIPASTIANETLLSTIGNIPSWGGCSVLQVVEAAPITTALVYAANTVSNTATNLTLNITPASNNSKILVFFSCVGSTNGTAVNVLLNNLATYCAGQFINAASQTVSGMRLFAPASTAQQTYTIYTSNANPSSTVYFNGEQGDANGAASPYRSYMIAIEIGGF